MQNIENKKYELHQPFETLNDYKKGCKITKFESMHTIWIKCSNDLPILKRMKKQAEIRKYMCSLGNEDVSLEH
jgi:hypothetical protein